MCRWRKWMEFDGRINSCLLLGLKGAVISNSYLERVEWTVPRAVSRLECEMVPLTFEIPFQPRFLLQELIFLSSKKDSLYGSPCERWLAHGLGLGRFVCFWISMQKAAVISGW